MMRSVIVIINKRIYDDDDDDDDDTHLFQHLCTYNAKLFVSFAVFIYYFKCISFAIRLSGRKVALLLN